MTPKHVLVTGGAGFIGSHLVEALLRQGMQVRVLDNLTRGHRHNLAQARGVELQVGDILNELDLQSAMHGIDTVFHLAALTSVPESMQQPGRYFQVCGDGTAKVLAAARDAGVRRVVYAASSSCYGDPVRVPISEAAPLSPMSPYASAKLVGERMCIAAHAAQEMQTVRLRFFNVYGPRQDPKSAYAGVITAFFDALTNGQTPKIYGDGLQTRDFVHVSDVVAALMRASVADGVSGGVFNVGTGVRTSLSELLQSVAATLQCEAKPLMLAAREGDVRHSCADVGLAKRVLGFEAKLDLATGLATLRDALLHVREAA